MGLLLDKYRAKAARLASPPPRDVASRAETVLRAGKRDQLRAGIDAEGRAFKPLAPSTLRGRRVSPTPLYGRRGDSGRLVRDYRVDARPVAGGLTVAAGWPSLPHVGHLASGTRRMPRRDPGGFRAADRDKLIQILREWRDRGDPG